MKMMEREKMNRKWEMIRKKRKNMIIELIHIYI